MKNQDNHSKTRISALCGLVLTFALCILCRGVVFAQTPRTLTVVPPSQDFKTKAGKQISANVKVRNETDEPITVKANLRDFIVLDDKGTPSFVEEAVSGRWSLSSWMIVSPTEFTINPRSSKVFDVAVIVPPDALPGGHYASVYFTPVENGLKENQSGSAVETRIASLFKLIVEGPVTEMAYLRKFSAPRFSEYGPITITTQIENQSDLDITPRGSIVITDLFGKNISRFQIEERRIFPYAVRSLTNTLEKKWLFGRYKATLNGSYGTTGQVLAGYLYFWVLPWKIILAVVFGLAILVLIGYWLGQKGKNKEKIVIPPDSPLNS
ncbi:MAG: hypothetical protein BWY24_00636 [Microgenomates group bacterium ADurb.Bin219]|nr:MAG: hypothetical protein BWY24_00636 [Microgenomates group bacterium ADurb.Bin219]HNP89173.1 hypothetical protein [Candidatus Woesebacteria bacterium]